MPRTLLLIAMISVLEAAALPSMGLGETSEAAPHAFCLRVSLAVKEPAGQGDPGLAGTIFPPDSIMCMQLKGPLELLLEKSQVPAVLRFTLLGPVVEL